jgi:hypothetical protein
MDKKVKLAMIRENKTNGCPFGLNIPDGCKCAGKTVKQMCPLTNQDPKDIKKLSDEDKKNIIAANNRVMLLSEDAPDICIYAHYIFEDETSKVECSYGTEMASGLGVANINAPRNLSQYLGIGYYSVPLGFYNENLTFNDGFESYVNRYFAGKKEDKIIKTDEESEKDNDK